MVRQKRLFHIPIFLALLGLIGSSSCTPSNNAKPISGTATPYFSLQDYFLRETDRLTTSAPMVDKTVSRNGISEKKRVQIDDWKNELALFIDADINKPAWRNSYRIDTAKRSLIYTSVDPQLRTQKITIERQQSGKVTHITIHNRTGNMLYQTAEQLDYYPDSLYRINKRQQIRFIGDSQYLVMGALQ